MNKISFILILLGFTLVKPLYAIHENEEKEIEDTLSVAVEPRVNVLPTPLEIQYTDEVTFFENDEIPVDSALFFEQVNALEYRIKMDYNSEVKRMIDFFGTTWQEKLKEVITLSEHYFPIYESIFDKNGLPLEMKYISVIESGLNPYATSRSGAVGCWQFMPYTGKMYDLKIDRYLDERRNVEMATQAACEYFKAMSAQYDDWLVVIASYNCGPGNINKAIRRSGGKRTFWEIYPYLPRQTQNYIPSFIAVAYLMNYYKEHNILPKWTEKPQQDVTHVTCTPNHNLKAISEVLGVSIEDIRALNPALKSDNIPLNLSSYNILLPTNKAMQFIDNEGEILLLSESYKAQIIEKTYVIKRGDSLGLIANRNGCTVSEIKEWNNLRSSTIHPGQKLKLYL